MNNLTIKNYKGISVIDSREVAEKIGKRHADLLRSIDNYNEILLNAKMRSDDFFIGDYYTDASGKANKCYLLTKQGCEMVANKLTGEKGVLFTAEYVQAFNKMEELVQTKPLTAKEELRLHYKALEEQGEQINTLVEEVEDIKNNSPLFNVECDELQKLVKKIGTKALGGYRSKAYKDCSIRQRVYKDIQHQLTREFGVSSYKAIKRCQLELAKKIIEGYRVPTVLEEEINVLNNQIEMEDM